jgi:hypothetical protein
VQDVFWLHQAAEEIRETRFSAYFVPLDPVPHNEARRLYAIMPLTREFRERYDAAWRRLTKNGLFRLDLFSSVEDGNPSASWYVFRRIIHLNPY